jgi:hypothetical protein
MVLSQRPGVSASLTTYHLPLLLFTERAGGGRSLFDARVDRAHPAARFILAKCTREARDAGFGPSEGDSRQARVGERYSVLRAACHHLNGLKAGARRRKVPDATAVSIPLIPHR